MPTSKIRLKPFQSVEALNVCAESGVYESLFRKKIKLRDRNCDVLCISINIQDGGQLTHYF